MAAKPFPLSVSRGAATEKPARVLTVQQIALRNGATRPRALVLHHKLGSFGAADHEGPRPGCRSRVPYQMAVAREQTAYLRQRYSHVECVPAYCPDTWRERSADLFACLQSTPVVEAAKMVQAAALVPRSEQTRRHQRAVQQWVRTYARVLFDFPLTMSCDFARSTSKLLTDSMYVLGTSRRSPVREPVPQLELALPAPTDHYVGSLIGTSSMAAVAFGPSADCPTGWY